MDIGLLRAFIEVYRARHFGRAANNLFISQSAVSARIRQLEDELGVKLFTRDRNNIDLTAAGERFLGYAENILDTWSQVRHEISLPDGVGTLLSVAAQPSIWDMYLDDWLVGLYANEHTIAIDADIQSAEDIQRNMLQGTIDLGFVFDRPGTARIDSRLLAEVPLILVSSQEGSDVQSAMKNGYVYVDWGTSFGISHARHFHPYPAAKLRVGVARLALDFILRSGGSAYLPEAMVASMRERLFRVEGAPVIEKEAYAIYPASGYKSAAVEEALAWFTDRGSLQEVVLE